MPGFEQGDLIRVPLPYTDRSTRQHRPALVISAGGVGEAGALLWVAMITSAENRPWPGDVAISDIQAAGLPAPSTVRPTKLVTIEARHAQALGRLDAAALTEVLKTVRRQLGFT